LVVSGLNVGGGNVIGGNVIGGNVIVTTTSVVVACQDSM